MVHFKNHTANEESIRVSEERSTSSGRRSHSTKDVADDTHQPSGRHTCAFWTIVWLIFALTVGNLILTLTIIGVLHLGRGMEYLEVRKLLQNILRKRYMNRLFSSWFLKQNQSNSLVPPTWIVFLNQTDLSKDSLMFQCRLRVTKEMLKLILLRRTVIPRTKC